MNALIAGGDTVLAATLCYYLYIRRSGFKKTDTALNRLMMYSMGSGLVTALAGIVGLICAVVKPDAFLYMVPDMLMAKCE